MTELSMIELHVEPAALMRFLHGQGLVDPYGDEDLGYGMHAWLKAAFGEDAPRPFRIFAKKGRLPRVLGYCSCGSDTLRRRVNDFASPAVYAVCPPDRILGRPMPFLRAGRRLDFEVLCCPVARKAGTGREKDVFLVRADHESRGSTGLDRGRVYAQWLEERFGSVARVLDIRLESFRLVRQTRRGVLSGEAVRKRARLTRPQALLRGRCLVEHGEGFMSLLARGIGRHRAFGYGMILLRPPS